MPLYLLGQALWLKLFPPTLFAVRSFTLLWIPLAVFSFYRFLWRVTSNARASALAACLFALSFIFIDNACFARPDLMCLALGLSGLAAYVEWRAEHLYRALIVSNAFVAASILTHPNGVFHLLGLAVLVTYYDRPRLNITAVAAAVLPYVVLGTAWAGYIVQDLPAFVDQMRGNSMRGRWTTTLNPAVILWNEIRLRYVPAFGLATGGWALMKLVALAAYLTAITGALLQPGFRRQPSTRLLLLLLTVYFAALSVFNQKLTYYLVHILPWYIALTGLYAEWLWEHSPPLRPALTMAVLLLVGVETGGILLKSHSRSQAGRTGAGGHRLCPRACRTPRPHSGQRRPDLRLRIRHAFTRRRAAGDHQRQDAGHHHCGPAVPRSLRFLESGASRRSAADRRAIEGLSPGV